MAQTSSAQDEFFSALGEEVLESKGADSDLLGVELSGQSLDGLDHDDLLDAIFQRWSRVV